MARFVISEKMQDSLHSFLSSSRKAELFTTYMFFLSEQYGITPVVYPLEKIIFQSRDKAIQTLEKEAKLWRETEIKIRFGQQSVNEETKKIYLCPFTGKVFGNNTHPNPQDAIYDWVSVCPENNERIDGLKVKRFFVSEDPDVIKNYITERKKPITKVVYSSVPTGKLFNSKEAVIADFRQNFLKPISLIEVQNQNRFSLEENFLALIQEYLEEEHVSAFVEALSEIELFLPHVERWLSAIDDEEELVEIQVEEEEEDEDEDEELHEGLEYSEEDFIDTEEQSSEEFDLETR